VRPKGGSHISHDERYTKKVHLNLKKYRPSQIDKLITKASLSNIAKSVRRIYFNGLNESTEERGFWHIDIMSGMGSGILINFEKTFFLLTAKHVLNGTQDKEGNFQNESPFWTSVKHKVCWKTMYDFLMPKKIWYIGELIDTDDIIDTSDVILIELYYPHIYHFPDN